MLRPDRRISKEQIENLPMEERPETEEMVIEQQAATTLERTKEVKT